MDPSSTESGRSNKFLSRAYGLSSTGDAENLYNEWATSYDNDLHGQNYASPQRTVDTVLQHLPNHTSQSQPITILDAGCGTGLVGECFAACSPLASRVVVDGNDLTRGMLEIARGKGVYRDLAVQDLNEPLPTSQEGYYDVVTCVGTLTKGHVGPKVFREFVKVVKPERGLVVATVHSEIWQSGGYEGEVKKLENEGLVEVVSTNEFGILKSASEGGRMVVLRKR